MDIAYGTLPDWVAAIGTAGALIAAVVLLRDDRRIRRAQDEEHTRDQAQKIGTWITSSDFSVYVINLRNASDLPIYNVTVEFGTPAGHDPWTSATSWITMPPGETDQAPVSAEASPTGAVILYSTSFTDSAGRSWRRDASGDLSPIEDLDYVGCS